MVGASKSVSPWSCDEFKYITLGIKDDYKYVFLRGGGVINLISSIKPLVLSRAVARPV